MNKERVLTVEAFDKLLHWLGPNRDDAGEKYEIIRRRLIKIFVCRGCSEAEDLADETINRVTLRLQDIEESYTGDPALYFYGVANKVHLEYLRRKPAPSLPPSKDSPEETEQEFECLEQCINQLPPTSRELIVQYYCEDKKAKIKGRQKLAETMGIALNALRIRTHRIRAGLQECMQSCLKRKTA